MTHFPESIGSIYTPERPERRVVAPVQPVRRADDSIRRQREMARTPVRVDKAESRLEDLRLGASVLGDDRHGRYAKRAVSAYTGVARNDNREYVSQMLGVDEFA